MEIQSTNVFDSMRTSINTPRCCTQAYTSKTPLKKDTCSLSSDLVLTINADDNDIDLGIYKMKINQKDGHIKFSEPKRHEAWIEGDVEGKKLLMHSNNQVYSGQYGDKEFMLAVDCDGNQSWLKKQLKRFQNKMPYARNYFNVVGTVNGEPVSIQLPNAKIPEDEDLKDLLSILLWTNHSKAKTINGEIKSVVFTRDGISAIEQRKEEHEKTKQKLLQNPLVTALGGVVTAVGVQALTKFINYKLDLDWLKCAHKMKKI